MARVANAAAVIVIVAVMAVAMVAESTNYTVGDSLGWSIPSNGATAYSDWANAIPFETGDVLVFNFTMGAQDVAVVTKEDFDACNIETPVDVLTDGPAIYSLDVGGEYYFTSTLGNGSHCQRGQQLAISVSDAPATSPSTLPVNPGALSPPKAGSNNGGIVVSSSLIWFFMAICFILSCAY